MTFPLEDCVCVLLINTAWKMMNLLDVTLLQGGEWGRVKLQGLAGIAQCKSDCIADKKTWVQIFNTHLKTLGLAMHIPLIIARAGVETGVGCLPGITSVSIERTWHLTPMHGCMHLHVCTCPDTDCSYPLGTHGVFAKPWRTVLAILDQTKAYTF